MSTLVRLLPRFVQHPNRSSIQVRANVLNSVREESSISVVCYIPKMRRQQRIWCEPQWVVCSERLAVMDVECRARDQLLVERIYEGRFVYDLGTGRIDKEGILPHPLEVFAANDAATALSKLEV